VHPPPGLPGPEPLDVSLRIRVFGQPFNMFSDNTPVFPGPLPDKRPDRVLDFYPHDLPRLKTEVFFGFIPGNVPGVFIHQIEIPLKCTALVLRNELSYRIPKTFSGFFQP
jgi:hypothetical protein